jgi:Tol biopolymer transport system component
MKRLSIAVIVIAAATGCSAAIAQQPVQVRAAAISPDGNLVAFSKGAPNGPAQLWITTFAGDPARQLTTGDRRVTQVGWATDGTNIQFLDERGGLFMIPQAGGEPQAMDARQAAPTRRSPDGKHSIAKGDGKESWIDLTDLKTGGTITVMPPGIARIVGEPSWSADGTRFVVVGSTDEHPAEVFAGSLPRPQSNRPDFVGGAMPPPIRRITFSNP